MSANVRVLWVRVGTCVTSPNRILSPHHRTRTPRPTPLTSSVFSASHSHASLVNCQPPRRCQEQEKRYSYCHGVQYMIPMLVLALSDNRSLQMHQ